MRRMVVVFYSSVPGNRALFETRPRPERVFAGSLAVLAVAIEPFSMENSLLTGKITGKWAWSAGHHGTESAEMLIVCCLRS